MGDLAIGAAGLGKCYVIGRGGQRHDTFRDLVSDQVRSAFRRRRQVRAPSAHFWALRDATFEIRQGENVGIIGLNGAGKSTLLKILSRIIEPNAGSARVCGRVGALLEVGTGFHAELTGRENVFLYGAILGMSKDEIGRRFDDIVAFAEISKFIDTPVKRYSSGMYVRLAFSVAAQLRPEILLLDEVLAVGDLSFQRKCIDYAKSLQRSNATILFVSHNMFSIKSMCDRVIYLKSGKVTFDGPTDRGIAIYEEDCKLGMVPWIGSRGKELSVSITESSMVSESGEQKALFCHSERMFIRFSYEARERVEGPNFIVAVIRSDGVACCNYNSVMDELRLDAIEGKGTLEVSLPPLKLVAEMYTVQILVRAKHFGDIVGAQIGGTFHIKDEVLDTHFGVFHEAARWAHQGTGDKVSDLYDE